MRLSPFRRRLVIPPAPSPEDLAPLVAALGRHVEEVLAIHERETVGGVVAFRGRLTTSPRRALDILLPRFRPLGCTPALRGDGDLVTVQAWPWVDGAAPPRPALNLLLFALTCLSMLFAGWLFYVGSPTFDALRATRWWFLAGFPFAGTLLAILTVHEFGHYFTARHHRAAVSLPYFIPAPPPFPFGTLGAIIRMRAPARDRNALFDIAAAGPLAGLAVALPAIVIGLEWSKVAPVPPGGGLSVWGGSVLWSLLVWLRFGPIPEGAMLFTHPVADAAWAGFLVTAINLFPVGQLDGGRVAYALFGRRHRSVGIATVIAMVALGLVMLGVTGRWEQSAHWFVWATLIFLLIGFHHGPPLDDLTPLTPGRRAVGVACLVLMVLLVPPVTIA